MSSVRRQASKQDEDCQKGTYACRADELAGGQSDLPDRWVVLSDLDMDEVTLEIRSAVVRGISKGRRQAFDRAEIREGEAFAHFFTGRARHPHRW